MGNPSGLKLGELLIKNEVITGVQLAQAVRAQQLFGGRLGTNLVELGFLSEQVLTKFLSRQLTIAAVPVAALDSVSEKVLSLVPRAIAERYQVVPISLSGNKLRVAMSDPTDLKGIDDVSFATGYQIQPLLAPELLIVYALEKHYGIARSNRYLRLNVPIEMTGTPSTDEPGLGGATVMLEQERRSLLSVEITAFAAKVMQLAAEGKVPQEVVEGVSDLIAKVDRLQFQLNRMKGSEPK